MPPKRSVAKIEPGAAASAPKRTKLSAAAAAIKQERDGNNAAAAAGDDDELNEELQARFIALFSQDQYKDGVSNAQLLSIFGDQHTKLVPIINTLSQSSRINLSMLGDKELYYTLVPEEIASKFVGLGPPARLVYQSIQRAGTSGAWARDIRRETNIQLQALNRVFKVLEGRKLIKQVKSVNNKSKKMYMLYELQPSTELTGGVWYSDLEFDHEFISELRGFLLQCLRRLHNGTGCTIAEVLNTMEQAGVSKVKLTEDHVNQLMRTLLFDHLVEEAETEDGKKIYTASRRVSTACDFKWWTDAVAPDFHFRTIKFEDGVVLDAHEPHYHTESK